jgi:sec-independent protein translocase protein TatA
MSMFITLGVIGVPQIIFLVVIVILLFGAKRIPELMKGAGRGVKEFKDALNKDYSADDPKSDNKKIE